MKRILGTMLLLLIVATGFCKNPKYIFYFIGDGMGPSHVRGTELFFNEVYKKDYRLTFTAFPQAAFVTTHSASNGVTDSAASGTALATGSKANNGNIGVDANGNDVYSVAHAAKEAGLAVGIATTVPINHATPSAFYAHKPNFTQRRQQRRLPLLAQKMQRAACLFVRSWKHLSGYGIFEY